MSDLFCTTLARGFDHTLLGLIIKWGFEFDLKSWAIGFDLGSWAIGSHLRSRAIRFRSHKVTQLGLISQSQAIRFDLKS